MAKRERKTILRFKMGSIHDDYDVLVELDADKLVDLVCRWPFNKAREKARDKGIAKATRLNGSLKFTITHTELSPKEPADGN